MPVTMHALKDEVLELDARWSVRYRIGRESYLYEKFGSSSRARVSSEDLDRSKEFRQGYYDAMFAYGTGDG